MKFLSRFLICIFVVWGCGKNTAGHQTDDSIEASIPIKPVNQEKTLGTNYADSTIRELISGSLTRHKSNEVDSSKALHSFNSSFVDNWIFKPIGIDQLKKYKNFDYPVTKAQAQILHVTDLIGLLDSTANYNSYIFFDKTQESHFGASFKLINISKHSNQFNSFVLTQAYGNENYEYLLQSKFKNKTEFEQTKFAQFNIHNQDQSDDSISVSKSNYKIDELGNILKQNITKTNSE